MAAGGALIGALRVTLGLDSAQFEAGTKRVRAAAKRDVGEIQKIMGGVKTAFAGLATAATATAFAGAAKRALDFAGGLGELAQRAGISTRALQEYAAIGVDVGLTNDDVVSSFARLSKTLGEAQDGDKKAAETFRQLGIDVRGLTAEDAMPKLIAAFEKIKSPTDQARLAADLFGRTAGAKLLPLLNMTADGFEKARLEAHELGLVLSEDSIASADAAADAIAKLTKVVEVNFAAAMSTGADGTAAFAAELSRMIARLPEQTRELQKFAAVAAQGLRALGPIGQAGADMAARNVSYLMTDKQFRAQMRSTAKRLRANPNDNNLIAYGEFLQQQARDRMAARNGPSAAPDTSGGIEPRTDRSSGGRKGGGRDERDRTAEYLERFNREMESLKEEQLRLEIDQTQSLDHRAQLEAQRILNEREAYKIDIDNRVKAGELNAAQAEKLKLAVEQIAADKQTIMWNEIQAKKLEEQQRLADVSFDIREDVLRLELDSARTQEERRAIEMRLLDIEYEREKAALDHLKALYNLGQVTMAEVDAAEDRFNAMGDARSGREAAIRRNTMGPLEQYLDSLPKSAAELNEAYQQVAADGLQSLNDGIVDAIMNAKNLGDVFKNVANQIIADLLRIAVQRAITEPLANALFGGGSGGGGGGLFASIGKLFGGGGSMAATDQPPGLAKGGSFMVGGNPGIDRNMLAINGIPQVRVSAGERVRVTKPGQGDDASPVQIVPSPYFDVVVDGRVVKTGGGLMRNQTQTASRRGRQRLA